MSGRIFDWIDGMRGKRVAILGDMIADVYLTGKIARISREAPVLVLEHQGERVVPGGAANARPAANAATLCRNARLEMRFGTSAEIDVRGWQSGADIGSFFISLSPFRFRFR